MSSPFYDTTNTRETDAGNISSARDTPPQQPELEDSQDVADSTLPTPEADEPHFPLACALCSLEFPSEASSDQIPAEALRAHMSSAHPSFDASPVLTQDVDRETRVSLSESANANNAQFPQEQQEMSAEHRCRRLWNIHDPHQFTGDYDNGDGGLPDLWARKFDGFQRPKPYEKTLVNQGEFLPITNPDIIVDLLKNPESHNPDELYAITANVAHILKVWQDEYMAIERLRQRATESTSRKKPKAHTFEDPAVFEDKKEAMLYGFKHDPSENRIGRQDPFLQGGFAPTATQLAKMHMEAKARGTRNIDGWTPIIKNGEEYIPMIGPEPPVVKKKKPTNARSKEADVINEGDKRNTRFGGAKHPPTRETSLGPSAPSSPVGGRGRIGKPRAASSTPQKGTFTQPPTSVPTFMMPHATTKRGKSITTATTPVTSSPAGSATPSRTATPYPDPLLDPKNQEKIRKSKNPRRTEAMILHWAKFNSEGRTRNPKRSKAQIEADKAAERNAAEKAQEKKRKFDGSREPGTSVFSIKRSRPGEGDLPGSPLIRSSVPESSQPSNASPSDAQTPME